MTALPAPLRAATVAWPEDDSYRGHIDVQWLRALATWIASIEPPSPWRFFYVLANRGV